MSEFDFDVITGPSGPMRRGTSACGWTPAEEADPPALVLRPKAPPDREERRDTSGDI